MSSLRSTEFDDIYFSPDDGPAETMHVFMGGNDLPARWQGRDMFTIGELGFGTGLNFLLAAGVFMETCPASATLDFVSVEKYPLAPAAIDAALRPFAARIGTGLLDELLAAYPPRIAGFHRLTLAGGRVRLTLALGDVMDALPQLAVPRGTDAWFLDGFAPAKNPDMWRGDVFAQLARLSAPGATCATFTVAGAVRRGLAAAGFAVEKRRGFGRKREMLAGRFTGAGVQAAIIAPPRRVAVIGGGLAGAAAAWALRARGVTPVIFEQDETLSAAASGNRAGLCNPRLSAQRTAQADVYAAGYARALRLFPALGCGFHAGGNLHLAHTEERARKFGGAALTWGWDGAHMSMLDRAAASDAAGAALPCGGLWLPDTGLVDPAALCAAYAAGIDRRAGAAVIPARGDAGWIAGGEAFDAVVLATGPALARAAADLPLEPVRGQITMVAQTPQTAALRANLCYGGYFGAARDGRHVIGATFQRGDDAPGLRAADDADNIAKLAAVMPDWAAALRPVAARAGVRCAARDRFPVAGMIEDGLYVSGAHGSHGLVTTLAAGEWLADLMTGSARSLGAAACGAFDPARFRARAERRRAPRLRSGDG